MKNINVYFPLGIILFTFVNFRIEAQVLPNQWEKLERFDSKNLEGLKSNTPKVTKVSLDLGSGNHPSPRQGAMLWNDKKGSIYMFGGEGVEETGEVGVFNELWSFNLTTQSWELKKGNRKVNQKVERYAKSIESFNTQPEGRKGASTWVDKNGDLWMFGGRGFDNVSNYDQMWHFSAKKNTWILMGGSDKTNQKNNVSIKKENSAGSLPGARYGSAFWTDKDGNFWMFGGSVYSNDKAKDSYLADLWQFDFNKKTWILVAGPIEEDPKVSPSDKEDFGRIPSARAQASSWYNSNNNSLYIYGGYGLDPKALGDGGLSDLWQFDIIAKRWILLKGKSGHFEKSNTGVTEVASDDVTPGFRHEAINWTDDLGDFWLFGGQRTTQNNIMYLNNDIWKYSPSNNKWMYIQSNGNPPIQKGGNGFSDSNGNLWIFGGNYVDSELTNRVSNDLWKFKTK
ncbi:kelch repeat-containing protein [Lacihabitans sp. CS3-21]|uniref:kelch repeat-containing protein n=1 Tax=Lacihabitans sp. CS3-21 TaxID=2487332 RepID=UPI0020CF42D3|nr:kelch repeat-containing protein [Lacihabitans sp. CS3-21]MCP9747818.1 hypothetical protein [Lacihabitans sp. CS3-21]